MTGLLLSDIGQPFIEHEEAMIGTPRELFSTSERSSAVYTRREECRIIAQIASVERRRA